MGCPRFSKRTWTWKSKGKKTTRKSLAQMVDINRLRATADVRDGEHFLVRPKSPQLFRAVALLYNMAVKVSVTTHDLSVQNNRLSAASSSKIYLINTLTVTDSKVELVFQFNRTKSNNNYESVI